MVKTRKKQVNFKNWVTVIVIIALLVIGSVFVYKWNHTDTASTKPVVKGTPSTAASAPTSTSTPAPSSSATATDPTGQGGVVDNNGQTTGTIPPPSEWTSSTSGDITLQQPTNNSTVKSGNTISGLANTSTVSFILKDTSVGVIGQGSLNVVNGKFSGTLQFTPHANTGSLEVYYPNPSSGAEEDIINITVNYGT
jgi:hypothetical protein